MEILYDFTLALSQKKKKKIIVIIWNYFIHFWIVLSWKQIVYLMHEFTYTRVDKSLQFLHIGIWTQLDYLLKGMLPG